MRVVRLLTRSTMILKSFAVSAQCRVCHSLTGADDDDYDDDEDDDK